MGDTPLAWAAANRYKGVVKIVRGQDDIGPTSQVRTIKHHYYGLLAIGMREW